MKKPALILIAFLTFTSFIRCARAGVDVTPFRLQETRATDFGDDKVGRSQPSMELTLSLNGPEAESAVRYGDLKLEEAVDELGNSLIPEKEGFHDPAKFKEYANAFFRKSRFGGDKPAAPQVEIDLALSKRAATKIARLRGSLSVANAGTIQSVELANLGAGPKAMPIPEAANLKITASVTGENSRSVSLEISGDDNALESIIVIDAAGKDVSNGMSSWSMNGGPEHKSLGLNKPLDASMKLVAKVALNRKITKVPFDLKDIPLP